MSFMRNDEGKLSHFLKEEIDAAKRGSVAVVEVVFYMIAYTALAHGTQSLYFADCVPNNGSALWESILGSFVVGLYATMSANRMAATVINKKRAHYREVPRNPPPRRQHRGKRQKWPATQTT